jgi:hypothetical protein
VDCYEIPAEFAEPRWGVAAWRHPAVMELIEQTNPDADVGTMLDTLLHSGNEASVSQTAAEWWTDLNALHEWTFRRACANSTELGKVLRRLAEGAGWGGRIKSETQRFGSNRQPKTVWTLSKAVPATANGHG